MSYESIMAGTEVQEIRERINTIKNELYERIEMLTGLQAKAIALSAHPDLSSVKDAIDAEMKVVEDYCVGRIMQKARDEGLA